MVRVIEMYDIDFNQLDPQENTSLFFQTLKGYLDRKLPHVTNLANMAAIIKAFHPELNWAGFYLFLDGKLILGPFQGLPACTEISLDRGVCGKSATTQKSVLVEDTRLFPGHIVCDQNSRSELVVPIIKSGKLFGVLDLDSPETGHFTASDQELYEKAVNVLVDFI